MEPPFTAYQGDEPYIFISYAHEDADLVYPDQYAVIADTSNDVLSILHSEK